MALTPKDYSEMTRRASPNTKSWRNIPLAFAIGGLICTLGQALTQYVSIGPFTEFTLDGNGDIVITFPAGAVTDAAHGEQSFIIPRP